MSIETVMRGIETMRTLLRQNTDPATKVDAAKTLIEQIRNDAQDYRDFLYAQEESERSLEPDNKEHLAEVDERLFRWLGKKSFTDLASFYGRVVFEQCASNAYRYLLAVNLLKVAAAQGFTNQAPKLWLQISESSGNMPTED